MDYMVFNECFDIFCQCHNLKHLWLRSMSSEYDGVVRPRVVLPDLVSLRLDIHHHIEFLWNNLSLPKLQEGSFWFLMEDVWPKSEFFALLDRSSCELRTLQIPEYMSEDDSVECVERIPSLRSLNWRSAAPNERAFSERVTRMLEQRATNLD
jgi:hypothetical protein